MHARNISLLVDGIYLRAVNFELVEKGVNSLTGDPEGADGVYHAIVARLCEVIDMDVLGLAELGHIGQQVHVLLMANKL